MALKKSSKFEDMDSGLFIQEPSINVQAEPEIGNLKQEKEAEKPLVKPVPAQAAENAKKEEVKGSCRLSISFKPDTYRYVSIEARRRGMTISKFVNQAMEEYKASPKGRAAIEDWL